ncbi:MAG: hypothetical protein AAB332_06975, partial [Planctomycetota bacterium]
SIVDNTTTITPYIQESLSVAIGTWRQMLLAAVTPWRFRLDDCIVINGNRNARENHYKSQKPCTRRNSHFFHQLCSASKQPKAGA